MHQLTFFKKYRWDIGIIACITLFALVFRFYHYSSRWGLASDQARDALVALVALQHHTLPLIGPFSASGPFVFGPYEYWFLELAALFSFQHFLLLWVFQSILSFGIIFFMIEVGRTVESKWFGYMLAFFTAISPAKIDLSTNLIASTLAGIISIVTVYFFLCSLTRKKLSYFFLLGLFTSLAISTHFEATPLLLLFPLVLILGKWNWKGLMLLVTGFLIPCLPLFLFDIESHFYESSHILTYLFIHHTTVLPKRWLTFLTIRWPYFWQEITGGNTFVAYSIMLASLGLFIWNIRQKSLSKPMIGVGIFIFVVFIFLRYFQGAIFGNFLAFLDSFVLILSTWLCMQAYKINKILGIVVFLIISLCTMQNSWSDLTSAHNLTALNSQVLENDLIHAFPPNTKFQVYDSYYQTSRISLPLVLYLQQDNKLSPTGVKVGISDSQAAHGQIIIEEDKYYHTYIFNLNDLPSKRIAALGWDDVSPEAIYNSVEHWWR